MEPRDQTMADDLGVSAQRVQDALLAAGVECRVVTLPASTRSAMEAAQAIGCRVEQIAKSIVFTGRSTGRAILVIASGINRVNEQRLTELVGEPLAKADAEFVRRHTGFAIGGVPPVGHLEPILKFVDQDLLAHADLWAAAGTPNAVFRLTPSDLLHLTGAKPVPVK